MRRTTLLIIIVVMAMLCACNERLIYSEYGHTAVAGWEKSDVVKLEVPPIADGGDYGVLLSLRLNDRFPFTKLHLNVVQTVYPSGTRYKQTVTVPVTDNQGVMLGSGISYHQYDMLLGHIRYAKGDSVHIEISHNMKREILPGVADVGISLTKDR